MSDAIDMELVDTVLERFGLKARPPLSLQGLNVLYKAWCKHVPFDNAQKRLYFQTTHQGPLPGGKPRSFFESYLEHGTGGTCWSTSSAFYALTKALGFSVRLASGSVLGTPDQNFPNHGTVIATIEGGSYLLDTSMLSEQALPLIKRESSATRDPVYGIRAEPLGDAWRLFFKPGHSRDELECQLELEEIDHDFLLARYASTRQVSLFNKVLYARKNLPDGGIITIGRGKLIVTDPHNQVSVTPVLEERDALLIERFGFSEELVSRLPQDDEGDSLG
ncbi:arylamine N-acetyltransferase [Sorangium sp. So ce385]|uniref:arylamine N-acetyltransferase n=1 Tax=Sorangium sp. So ce385 TaxID=3133308 RepID=UPI003F5C9A8F